MPSDKYCAYRTDPDCKNNQELERTNEYISYICKGHLLNSHGDPLRENKFWVYPATMRPFNLGKGDYRS